MKKEEQIILTMALCDNIKQQMVAKISIDKVPEEWDGFELRHWLEKIANFENLFNRPSYKKSHRKRIKDCNNVLIVNNLY